MGKLFQIIWRHRKSIITAFHQWKLAGNLHIWHYVPPVKGLEGRHLNADATACESLIDLIDRMMATSESAHKRIPVSTPARMLVGPGHPWIPVSELLLEYPHDELEDEFWHLQLQDRNVLSLTVGTARMQELRESLRNLPRWKDDYALGPPHTKNRRDKASNSQFTAQCLWFWTKAV